MGRIRIILIIALLAGSWQPLMGQPKILWQTPNSGSSLWPSSIGIDGTVYSNSGNSGSGGVYALDGMTGAIKQKFITGMGGGRPAIALDGSVYVGCYDKKVYAFNRDGTKKWEFQTAWRVGSCPALGRDGTVYIGNDDGKIYALNGKTGAKKWEFTAVDAVQLARPAIATDGTVYIGCSGQNLGIMYALDGKTGAKKWEFKAGNFICIPAIGADGTVYVGSHDHKVYALDGKTGAKKWEFLTGDFCNSAVIGKNNVVYFGSKDQKVYAVDGATGVKKWETPVNATIVKPTLGPDGTLYGGNIFTGGAAITAIDTATGTIKWQFSHLQNSGGGPPRLGRNGIIYFATGQTVYALGVPAPPAPPRAYVTTLRTQFNKRTGKVELKKNGVMTQNRFLNLQSGGRLSRRQILRGYR